MGRIRSIKPEFPQSESLGRVSRDARLLFVMLFTIADDEGRGRAASRMLASLLFPYDDDAPMKVAEWLIDLERENCVQVYTIDGNTFFQIVNWSAHQKIDKPTKSKLPAPQTKTKPRARSTKPREGSRVIADDSSEDQGREGKGEDQGMDSAPQADAPKRSIKTKLPDNFPGPVELLKAREAWNEVARADLKPSLEAQKFRDHHLSHASKMADWAAAWRTWIGNAPKFTRKENFTNKRGSHVEGVHAAAELIAEFRAGEPGTDHRPDRSFEGPLLAPGDDDGPIEESVARVLPRFGGAH